MLPVLDRALRRSCFSGETAINLSSYHSHIQKGKEEGWESLQTAVSVSGKVLAQTLLNVQEKQGSGESWLGSLVASGARSALGVTPAVLTSRVLALSVQAWLVAKHWEDPSGCSSVFSMEMEGASDHTDSLD